MCKELSPEEHVTEDLVRDIREGRVKIRPSTRTPVIATAPFEITILLPPTKRMREARLILSPAFLRLINGDEEEGDDGEATAAVLPDREPEA